MDIGADPLCCQKVSNMSWSNGLPTTLSIKKSVISL
jgi:hypothetical protein